MHKMLMYIPDIIIINDIISVMCACVWYMNIHVYIMDVWVWVWHRCTCVDIHMYDSVDVYIRTYNIYILYT